MFFAEISDDSNFRTDVDTSPVAIKCSESCRLCSQTFSSVTGTLTGMIYVDAAIISDELIRT